MKAYKDRKKYVSCQEFIYRVEVAYNHWKESYAQLESEYKKWRSEEYDMIETTFLILPVKGRKLWIHK